MSYEKLLSGYRNQSYGKLLEKVYGNKKVIPVENAPGSRALVPAKSVKVAPVVRPGAGVASVIGKEIKNKEETDNVITVDQIDRLEGTYIIGRNGTGKSTLIKSLVLQDINNGLGVFVVAPDSDLVNDILSCMDKRLEDVVLIDLDSDKYVAPLNLFYCRDLTDFKERQNTISSFMHVLESFYGVTQGNPDMNNYFSNIARILMYNPQCTLLDIQRLLDDDAFRHYLVNNAPDDRMNSFSDYYEKYQRGMDRGRAVSFVLNKLLEFNNDVMQPYFASTGKALDFRKLMDEQKIVFVKLKPEWRRSSELLGDIVIAYLLDAAYSRSNIPMDDRRQVNVYVDEFQDIASLDFAKLFTRARKYRLGICVANQVRAMIDDTIKATCDQAANIFVFPVSPEDAKELANVFNCAARDGEVRYEAVEMPVKEPIQWVLDHGVHPLPGVRQFMNKFGKKLVEDAKYEEELERDHRHEVQNFQRDFESMSPHWTKPVITVTNKSRVVLENLNNLFYEAGMCGKRKESTDSIFIDVPLLVGTLLGVGSLSVPPGLENVADREKRVRELKERCKTLHLSSGWEVKILSEEKERIEKEYREFLKKYLVLEIEGFLKTLSIIEYNSVYYTPNTNLDYHLSSSYEIRVNSRYPDTPCASSFSDAIAYYCNSFSKLWFPLQFLLHNVHVWESENVPVRFAKRDDYSDGDSHFLYPATVWKLKAGIDRMLCTDAVLEKEMVRRFAACKEPGFDPHLPYPLQGWSTRYDRDDYYNSFTLVHFVKESESEEMTRYLSCIQDIEIKITGFQARDAGFIENRIKEMEDEINGIESLQESINRYDAVAPDFEKELRVILRELAVAPIEADSGVTREVPTVIPASEVERVVVEEIKELRNFTARVKVPSGEYVISTIPPTKGLDNKALQERIAGIQERNLAAGYLRLRSDVEREILERQQSPELVKQETAVAEKSRQSKPVAPGAGVLVPGVSRRKAKKGE